MRIAFAIPGDIDAPSGGYRYDRRMLAELRALGHEVTHLVLPGSFPDPSASDIDETIAALRAADADVLLVDGLAYSVLPASALRQVKAPLVALVHHPLALETGLSEADATRYGAAERSALTVATRVVVTSPPTADTLVSDFAVPREAITVAVPGLDPRWQQPRTPVTPPKIVAVGSLIARKGHDVLLDALSRIMDIPWEGVIIGSNAWDPETAAGIEAMAAPMADRLTLTGALHEDDIRQHYAGSTLFTLATRYEGFGMVFLEAMASGLPIVATRGGAVPSVVPPEAGVLVDVDDPVALADALRRVLTDETLAARLSDGARAAAKDAATWEMSAAAIADCLSGAVGAA
ncbi:glycosyl transferase family 1 [Acuticoccus sediminis]|uniref:Glycosyl transferase family 1 n=1 Tax=Acuticoccus sediminis TaxID=2184697 RepID=A0A8B2NZ99_9HYPH|nr:glycosyltransferase family 4 protein [Acuticoccus sediminis]RAI04050.1 glycosyl transferase family 1 [Acuticoccus sediminis]